MKSENMKVGMKVVVKSNATGTAAEYIGKVVVLKYDEYWCFDGCRIVSHDEIRKATQDEIDALISEPQHDIPQKAWLLREVVVVEDIHGLHNYHGWVSGYTALGNVLVEFADWTDGHDGVGIALICGWDGDVGVNNYFCLSPSRLAFVNEDGSRTPITEEVL